MAKNFRRYKLSTIVPPPVKCMQHAYHNRFIQQKIKFVAAICILMQNIGAMSSYMYIIKNQLPSVLHTIMCNSPDSQCPGLFDEDIPWYFNGNIIMCVVVCCIVMPLASLKSIEFLGK